MLLGKKWLLGIWALMASACVSMNDKEVPEITQDMPLEEAFEIGIVHGGASFAQLKNYLKDTKQVSAVHDMCGKVLLEQVEKLPESEVWRVAKLYQATSGQLISPKVVATLIEAQRPFVRQLGWSLAAQRPSDIMAALLERLITEAIISGDEQQLYLPEMAAAVKANDVSSVYTLLQRGLLAKGGVAFVDAMIHFNREFASPDFMDYLAMATVDELRQMNQASVDLATCLEILKFFVKSELPLQHPRFDHLFLYAVSRNAALADLAKQALEKNMTKHRAHLAYALARLPVWIQLAYVEDSRERLNASLGLFLTELRDVTAHVQVVEEINTLRR